jgi:two-component system sensor kinase
MLEAAKFLAEGDVAWVKANIESKLGELAFKRGDMRQAATAIERGLRHLKRSVPRHSGLFIPRLLWEVAVQSAHTWLPYVFLGRRTLEGAEKALLSVRLYGRLARAYWFAKGTIPALWAHLRGMNLAERYPPTLELAQAYSEHAPGMSLVPLYRRAFKYAERSFQLRKERNDVWGQAQSLHFHGIVLYAASRFEECIEKCSKAVRLLERTGDYWEMNMARYQIAASLYRLGDLPAAVAEAKRIHKSGLELGDIQASGIILDVWAWASGGKVPADDLQVELARERDDAQATAQVLVAEGVRLLSVGRADDAVSALEKARREVRKAGVKNAWIAPVLPWLATALREQANRLEQYTPGTREAIMRRARVVVRKALRLTRNFRNDLPHALREAALLMASQGRSYKARRFFDRSLAAAERQAARYERAQTLLHRGRVGRELGWPDAERDLADAESLLATIDGTRDLSEDSRKDSVQPPATLSLVDRFETVLEMGRKIAAALDGEQIYRAVHQAADRLLRCEQCVVLSVSGRGTDPELSVVCGDKRIFSRPLVRRTLESRLTVVVGDVTAEGNESLMLPDVRSILCAPIFVHDEAVAAFCVTHGQIPNLFGEEEVRLADFIATIAGAAIENSRNFSQLQQLNVTLEQRVADRTGDLRARTEELARSNSELEQFAYVASHDLQEPLRTITGYCKLLEQECDRHTNEKAREYIAHAVDGANRMKTLINDLLAYSRVGSRGRDFEATDCGDALNVALRNLQTPIAEAKATVSRDPLPTVMADPTQLIQVFQNLIGNAVKFRGLRRPEIHIGAQRRDSEWCFSVRDNGIGIEPEERERVFKIFHRLHGRTVYEGTGVGLAICKKTVERHGGKIWVESEVGEGSTFFFTLPATQEGNPPESPVVPSDADEY